MTVPAAQLTGAQAPAGELLGHRSPARSRAAFAPRPSGKSCWPLTASAPARQISSVKRTQKHKVWIRRCAAGSAPAVSPIVHARSAQVGIRERDSRRGWGQQLVVRGKLHSPMGKLVMRVAHVAPIRAWCFNSKRTSFHVALELEHVESVDLRSEVLRKAETQFCLPSRVRASAATHSSASRGEAGVVCCFDSGCNTSVQPVPTYCTYPLPLRGGRRFEYTCVTYDTSAR